ncbi:hypothetical protein Unana1_04985 [Umbelopsis nana]
MAITVDGNLHNAPTNCTIVSVHDSDDGWDIWVTYPVPGHTSNYTSYLSNTDNSGTYFLNQTMACSYSTTHPEVVLINAHGVTGGTIFGLFITSLFTIPVAAVALAFVAGILVVIYRTIRLIFLKCKYALIDVKVRVTEHMTKTKNTEAFDDRLPNELPDEHKPFLSTISGYMVIPLLYCRKITTSGYYWVLGLFQRTRKQKSQPKEVYDLEDQNSQISRATSAASSYRSTKQLLSSKNHQERDLGDLDDGISVETRSL